MNYISITYPLIYQFKDNTNYKVTKCLKVFNCKTGRMKKRCYNNGSVGYWIDRKFVIINKGSKLLEPIPKEKLPF